jgi:hypothetical protein
LLPFRRVGPPSRWGISRNYPSFVEVSQRVSKGNIMTTPQKVFVALIAVAIAQAVFYYSQLPDPMASHFDGAGHPNGWSSKPVFFGVMFGMMAMIALGFLYLPKTLDRLPRDWISLPYRDHWLSDERRGETMHFIEYQLAWFGVVTLLLIIATLQFTIDANLGPHRELSNRFMWVFGAYMAFSLVWTVCFVAHFVRIRGDQESASN